MQRGGLVPGTEAHAGDQFAGNTGRRQRQRPPIARHRVTTGDHAAHLDLQPLDRRIDKARRSAGADLLAKDVPGLDRLPQLDSHAGIAHRTETRKAELDEGVEPRRVEGVAERVQVGDDVAQVRGDEMRQQPAVVQCGAPAYQLAAIRLLPEARDQRTQQQHLHRAHPRVRRHLESAEFE